MEWVGCTQMCSLLTRFLSQWRQKTRSPRRWTDSSSLSHNPPGEMTQENKD
ncbi:hypothetical protein I79_002931 [Cricetulus griseus]|uniref:Uncharacterized protein n=1 Tax=Cricetulus griseus TaxID=10029 RepID=G3GYM6_CRIGR|nr:hypothetical protein I79_002931 [Cricetulus griseus]